jgi:hypothetical protein
MWILQVGVLHFFHSFIHTILIYHASVGFVVLCHIFFFTIGHQKWQMSCEYFHPARES